MSTFKDYDVSPHANLTNSVEFDDFDAYLIDSITSKNTYSDITTLTVKVVSPPVLINAGENPLNPGSSNNVLPQYAQQLMFRGRIVGNRFISPHQLLKDPCNVSKFRGDNEALLDVINQHTMCISKYGYDGPALRIGDTVSISSRYGDVGPFDLQFCYFESVEEVISSDEVAANSATTDCSRLSDMFGSSGALATAGGGAAKPYAWPVSEAEDTFEFFEKLKNSSSFAGFAEPFLWGIVANAYAESGFRRNIGGDPESLIGEREYDPVKGYCSFGFWQMNLCSANGSGSGLLKYLVDNKTANTQWASRPPGKKPTPYAKAGEIEGYSKSQQDGIFEYITREDVQFWWMSEEMKRIFPQEHKNTLTTPKHAGNVICTEYERPKDRHAKGVQRGILADKMATEYSSRNNSNSDSDDETT